MIQQITSPAQHIATAPKEDLRHLLCKEEGLLVMYVGNLESYQGIDLLLESFALVVEATHDADLVIIGGEEADISKYRRRSQDIGIDHRVHFLGPRPVSELAHYLQQADILVSPRIKGKNTPMKIYSYLGSGKAVIATNLETHTQVLTEDVSMLADPIPSAFATGLLALIQNSALRQTIGEAGEQMIQENFSIAAFRQRANGMLDWVQSQLEVRVHPSVTS